MNKLGNEFIAVGVAAVVAVMFFFIIDIGWLFALGLTAISFVGTLFVLGDKKPKELIAEDSNRASLVGGNAKLNAILKLGRQIQRPSMREKVSDVCTTIQKILAAISEDPSKVKAADQFLNFYLDSTIKILTMYTDLSATNVRDSDIMTSLAKTEATFSTLKDAFEKQLAKLMSNDAMNLDAELHLLEQTINMEGLGKSLTK